MFHDDICSLSIIQMLLFLYVYTKNVFAYSKSNQPRHNTKGLTFEGNFLLICEHEHMYCVASWHAKQVTKPTSTQSATSRLKNKASVDVPNTAV